VPEIVERMESCITSWQKADDHRAIFLMCYTMMTKNMLNAIEQNAFEDSDWVGNLTHIFAQYYFDALEAYDNEAQPAVWTSVFEAACHKQLHVLQNLLLGVNAHICYDLIFALTDSLEDDWITLSDEKRAMRYRDYTHVNHIIGTTIDAVQDDVVRLYDKHMAIVDFTLGRMDEWMIQKLITRWRKDVWEQTVAYLSALPQARPNLRETYTKQAEQRSQAIQGQRGILGIVELF
jgi:hypothetical protein